MALLNETGYPTHAVKFPRQVMSGVQYTRMKAEVNKQNAHWSSYNGDSCRGLPRMRLPSDW